MTKPAAKALPTMSLAKKEVKEGSKEWLDNVAINHGDTDSLKLEKRRRSLSQYMAIIEGAIKNAQIAKKAFNVNAKKMREATEKQRAVERALGQVNLDAFDTETAVKLADIDVAISQQVLNYEVTIANLTAQMANIEGHCLNIDCHSIREEVKVKGKNAHGISRWSSAAYLQDIGIEMFKLRRMVSDLYKEKYGEPALILISEELSNDDEEEEVDEDDVLTPEDAEEMKKASMNKKEE